MGSLGNIEREFYTSWAESLNINTHSHKPLTDEINDMVSNRKNCLFLRKKFHLN